MKEQKAAGARQQAAAGQSCGHTTALPAEAAAPWAPADMLVSAFALAPPLPAAEAPAPRSPSHARTLGASTGCCGNCRMLAERLALSRANSGEACSQQPQQQQSLPAPEPTLPHLHRHFSTPHTIDHDHLRPVLATAPSAPLPSNALLQQALQPTVAWALLPSGTLAPMALLAPAVSGPLEGHAPQPTILLTPQPSTEEALRYFGTMMARAPVPAYPTGPLHCPAPALLSSAEPSPQPDSEIDWADLLSEF